MGLQHGEPLPGSGGGFGIGGRPTGDSAWASHRRNDNAYILPPVPGGSAGQSEGYRSFADYLHPVRTTKMASFFTALERPVIVPLLHLTIWLSPLVWLSNWMSYLNGSAFLSTKSSGFAGTETWEAPDFVTRFQLQASPAVLAQGMFGMLRYDATAALKAIKVPALVLAGNRDPVCTPEASERMQRDIPGA
jgi:pimeloyl-ACP methyl ester carboxylesterase